LLYEDFENSSGYDLAGWAADVISPGTVNPDNTTNVLYGTQSLAVNESHDDQTRVTNSFADSSHIWVSFRLRIPNTPVAGTAGTIMSLKTAADSCQMRVRLNSDMELSIQPDCSTSYITGFPLSLNATYIIWIEWNKDNGANSYASIAYSTIAGIRPTDSSSGQFIDGTGSQMSNVSLIQLGHSSAENGSEVDFIMDHLLIDDVQIGTYP
jgi:hypothetical protein